jgi:hypothetical protein
MPERVGIYTGQCCSRRSSNIAINLGTAEILGLTIPPGVLAIADDAAVHESGYGTSRTSRKSDLSPQSETKRTLIRSLSPTRDFMSTRPSPYSGC